MTLTETEMRPADTDQSEVAHYVAKDGLTAAYIEGTPIRALCGVLFVPHRDPERLPVCGHCKEIWLSLSA